MTQEVGAGKGYTSQNPLHSQFLRILTSHPEHTQDGRQCCPFRLPQIYSHIKNRTPHIHTATPHKPHYYRYRGSKCGHSDIFPQRFNCELWICLYLPKIRNNKTGFTFLENCVSKNKKKQFTPCHQHNSSVFRVASLEKTHKQGQQPSQRWKMAEEDAQTVASVHPKEQLTKQNIYLRGKASAQGAGCLLGSIILGTH